MIDWSEIVEIVLKTTFGGAVGYFARRLLKESEKELGTLQDPSMRDVDRDKEELLAHYVEMVAEQISDADDLTVKESFMIIKSRTGVFATYLHLKVQRLSLEGENPKGV